MDAQATTPAVTEEPATAEAPAADQATVIIKAPAADDAPTVVEPPAGVEIPAEPRAPGFRGRGQMRRRLRFLRKARELAYRDLGGLVFEIYRQSERRDELVAAKVEVLGRLDEELRALETALEANSPVTVLREAGIAACPKCAAIHGSGDRFCPACGLPMDRRADRPITATPVQAPTPPPPPPAESAT